MLEPTENSVIGGEVEASLEPPVRAKLKWFNTPKGFGFVVPEDEPDLDAFLHITTLQKSGINTLGDGACLLCQIQRGPKGAHVINIVELVDAGNLPEQIRNAPQQATMPIGNTQRMGGEVKWYKEDKGFGFVIPDDGMKDVFIHKTCLEKNGIEKLETGQRVSMLFRAVPKGREVVELEIVANS
ncbi:MAG: cold shock domain-containing protein [Micavibrio sp.]